jgi:acyl carrier protein
LNPNLPVLIADILLIPLEKVTDELTMSEVESWDSLQHMNLIATLEQAFKTEFTFDEIVSMQSVAKIKKVLKGKGFEI